MFIAALFAIAMTWKWPKCPSVHEQMKKMWYIYTIEYYAAGRKESLSFVTVWVEVKTIMPSEISQSVKDKYHMVSLIGGI